MFPRSGMDSDSGTAPPLPPIGDEFARRTRPQIRRNIYSRRRQSGKVTGVQVVKLIQLWIPSSLISLNIVSHINYRILSNMSTP